MLAGCSGGKQVVASCEHAHGQKGAEAETRKSMYEHKTTIYFMGIRMPSLLSYGLLFLPKFHWIEQHVVVEPNRKQLANSAPIALFTA
jgi:hypothetical protein